MGLLEEIIAEYQKPDALSARQLGKLTNIPQSTVTRILNGTTKNPSTIRVELIAKAQRENRRDANQSKNQPVKHANSTHQNDAENVKESNGSYNLNPPINDYDLSKILELLSNLNENDKELLIGIAKAMQDVRRSQDNKHQEVRNATISGKRTTTKRHRKAAMDSA